MGRRPPWPGPALAGALALLAAAAVSATGQRAELERSIRQTTLPNGLQVIVVQNHGVPLATVEIDVRNGSFTQDSGFDGLSHLYEHMFFRADSDYPEPDAFEARASQLGAVFNGSTEEERVNYYLTLPSDSVDAGMRLMASAVMKPLFRSDELDRERAVVIGEYDRDQSQPGFGFQRAMGRALWGGAWPRKDPLGRRVAILETTPEQMREIQHRYYVPNNSALIVTGDVDPQRIFTAAARILGGWKRTEDPFTRWPIPAIPALRRDTGVLVTAPISSAVVMLQWQGPSASEDPAATYAADVFSDVLNQPGSRLQRRLVDSGLFESIGVNYYTLNHVGPITISGVTSPGRAREAITALEHEIAAFADPGYFSSAELDPVKRQRIAGTMFGLERASGFAHQLGFWWAVTGLDYYLGYVDAMAHETVPDLQRYARRYIVGKPHVRGVLIDTQANRAVQLTATELSHWGERR
ncbi:MAG: insulinase family protein [Gemmatimonadota bacterium]|nr:insulinase family protein [Gemmatimonadota bacterium]MDE3171479.1 insulinase family protein [Gemmatimonadota bacterium]MDE3215076.1 insulinase family protein [Gemmatimonadota bacterium]